MTAVPPPSFEIDGIGFTIDIRSGADRGTSADDNFILVKTPTFIEFYRSLRQRDPKTILEVGMFEGGSLVLFDKMYEPTRLVGVDIRRPIEALERYRSGRDHISTYYNLSQDDARLHEILGTEFPHGIDLIVDDASHMYDLTRSTFHLTFPHLKPGGLYVVEDWSWAHKAEQQNPNHPWYRKDALTNLVLELIVNLPGSQQYSQVSVHRDLVVIEKAASGQGPIDLAEGAQRLRGRSMVRL